MNINGPIKIWRGVTNYSSGMELGEPDEILAPPSLIKKGPVRPTMIKKSFNGSNNPKAGGGKPRKFKLSRDEYLALRISGQTRDQIVENNGISMSTLHHHLRIWKISKVKDELAEMGKTKL